MTGSFCGDACGETVPGEQGSRYTRRESLRAWPGPRSPRRGPNVRGLRAQRSLSPLVFPVLRLHVSCRVRT